MDLPYPTSSILALLALDRRAVGRPLSDAIEMSRVGSLRRAAFKSDLVESECICENTLRFPQTGRSKCDLFRDTSDARGIFKIKVAL